MKKKAAKTRRRQQPAKDLNASKGRAVKGGVSEIVVTKLSDSSTSLFNESLQGKARK